MVLNLLYRFPYSRYRGAATIALGLAVGTASSIVGFPAFAHADTGARKVTDNPSITLRGTRADTDTPGQFNILPPNFGLEFLRSDGGGGGLIQVGVIQYNNFTVDSGHGDCTGPPGQLKKFWEYRPQGSNIYTCDNIGDTDGSRKTLRVERTTSGSQFWAGFFDGTFYVNHDINYDQAYRVWIGAEMPHTGAGDWNSNTTLCANWGSGTNAIDWQRTSDAWDGVNVPSWNTIHESSTYTESSHWTIGDTPTPLEIYFEANSC
jgi:hypothetical protein